MKKFIFIKILIIMLITITAYDSYALNVVATGRSKISQTNLRNAYNNALYNALLSSIKWYYKQNNQSIDVTKEYIKFIKSYTILEQNIDNNNVIIKLRVDLDDTALQDAQVLLNQHSDSLVYIHRGIENDMLDNKQINTLISSTLSSKQFSISNQGEFFGKIDDVNNDSQIEKAFSGVKSNTLIVFDFQPILEKDLFKDGDNNCELNTTVTINSKNKETKTLQITTGSTNSNNTRCYNESVKQASNNSIEYIRDNIVQLPENAVKLQKYEVKILNTNNLVITKNIIDTLLKRGLIKSSKTLSYTQKSVVFEVESYFSPEELSVKVKNSKLPKQPTKIDFGSKELLLDFANE